MYVTMFTTLAASIQNLIFKRINLEYSFYVQIMTFMGTYPGIFFQDYIAKKTGKVSPQVILLNTMLFSAMVATIVVSIFTIKHKVEEGSDMFKTEGYCPVKSV